MTKIQKNKNKRRINLIIFSQIFLSLLFSRCTDSSTNYILKSKEDNDFYKIQYFNDGKYLEIKNLFSNNNGSLDSNSIKLKKINDEYFFVGTNYKSNDVFLSTKPKAFIKYQDEQGIDCLYIKKIKYNQYCTTIKTGGINFEKSFYYNSSFRIDSIKLQYLKKIISYK